MCGGKTKDGGKVYGASVFYTDSYNGSTSTNVPPSDEVDRLELELQVEELEGVHDTYVHCLYA
jgi:hypothetical protein